MAGTQNNAAPAIGHMDGSMIITICDAPSGRTPRDIDEQLCSRLDIFEILARETLLSS